MPKKRSKTPLAIRYNNPGCIRDLKKRPYFDYKENKIKVIVPKRGNNGYAVYASKTDGMMAVALLLKRYQKQGNNTPSKIVRIYAPKSDGNNTSRYTKQLCQALGVSADTKLNMEDRETMGKLLRAITLAEGGSQAMKYYDDSVFEETLSRVCPPMQAEKDKSQAVGNSYYAQRPNWLRRFFSASARADYRKWQSLNQTLLFTAPDGHAVSLLDLGQAVQEGDLSLSEANMIYAAASQAKEKTYESVNRTLEKIMTDKQADHTMDKVVDQSKENCSQTLRQSGSKAVIDEDQAEIQSRVRAAGNGRDD